MRRKIKLLLGSAAISLAFVPTPPAGAEDLDALRVEVTPSEASVDLGERIDITVTVTNTGDSLIDGVVAHIDITDLALGGSVDPEDWVPTLSREIGALAPGSSATRTWNVQPISSGRFTLYAVALTPSGSNAASSNTLTVEVAHRSKLNPQGILPVSIGVPIVIGALLLTRVRRTR